MNNKIKLSIIGIILILLIVILYQIFVFSSVRQILYDYNTSGKNQIVHDSIKNYDSIMCQFGILDTKYSLITYSKYEKDREYLTIGFYSLSRPNLFSTNWQAEYTGGTTIKNTTFPELVKMVKEDCSQFQGGFVNEDPNGIGWTYTRAQTKAEKADDIRRYSLGKENLSPSFRMKYGDIDEMTDDEVIALKKKIDEEGLDRTVDLEMKIKDAKKIMSNLTDDRKRQVRERYGDWEDFTDEELVEWKKKIDEDFINREFILE